MEEKFLGKMALVDRASLAEAVEGLNARAIACADPFCVVYSSAKASYFLLYQPGAKEAALQRLGVFEEPAPGPEGKTLAPEPPTPTPAPPMDIRRQTWKFHQIDRSFMGVS